MLRLLYFYRKRKKNEKNAMKSSNDDGNKEPVQFDDVTTWNSGDYFDIDSVIVGQVPSYNRAAGSDFEQSTSRGSDSLETEISVYETLQMETRQQNSIYQQLQTAPTV